MIEYAMSKNSLILVLQNKQENSTIDMAKVRKSVVKASNSPCLGACLAKKMNI